LKEFVNLIRDTSISLGTKHKKPTASELKNIQNIRKKIFTSKDIMKGEIFTRKNLTTLRAKKGVSSKNWEKLIGKKSNQNYKKGQAV